MQLTVSLNKLWISHMSWIMYVTPPFSKQTNPSLTSARLINTQRWSHIFHQNGPDPLRGNITRGWGSRVNKVFRKFCQLRYNLLLSDIWAELVFTPSLQTCWAARGYSVLWDGTRDMLPWRLIEIPNPMTHSIMQWWKVTKHISSLLFLLLILNI